jgi:hypothetical protein
MLYYITQTTTKSSTFFELGLREKFEIPQNMEKACQYRNKFLTVWLKCGIILRISYNNNLDIEDKIMEVNKQKREDLGTLGPEESWECFEYDGVINKKAPKLKVTGTGVVRKADGTIKEEKV